MKSKIKKDNFIPNVHSLLTIYTYMYPLCLLCSLILFAVVVLQTIVFIKRRDLEFFLKYIQFYFCTIYAFNINFLYPLTMNNFATNQKSLAALFVLDESCVRPITRKKIVKLGKKERLNFSLWIIIVLSILGIINYSWAQNRERYMTVSFLLKQHMPLDSVAAQVMQWGIHLIFAQLAIPLITIPTYFIYFLYHLKVHLIMLIDCVDTFDRNGECSESKNIMKKILHIIERHLEVKRYSSRAADRSQLLIYALYMLNGIFWGLISLYSIISPQINTCHGVAMLLAYFVFAYWVCNSGQNYIDLSIALVDSIYNLKWYQWNTQCSKMYLILLTNASRGLKITFFAVVEISYDFFKKVCRITYGFTNFFFSFTVKK